MESNRILLFLIFGVSLLPKIYSVIYPSLIIKQTKNNYAVANEIQHFEDQDKVAKFSTSLKYQLYNACPEKHTPYRWLHALEVQELVIDLGERPLQQFIKGDFPEYNCLYPIRPIALQRNARPEDMFELEYDLGFLIHERNADFEELWKKYAILPKVPEYNFINFLTIKMDIQFETIKWVRHRIISRGLLEPDSALYPLPPNEKNFDFFGFDVNFLYTKENQRNMFFSIFGALYFRYYNHPDRCLTKVQLAPYEDFLLNTWKLPSFMELNTAAMWKQVHPQWRIIEIFVRKVARNLEPLIIETGTAGILILPIDNDKSESVYLRKGQKFPVPAYFWKVVKFEHSFGDLYTQAIMIVMHNDPYTENQESICDDVGKNLGWMVSNNHYTTGLTYVCSVHEDTTSKLQIEPKGNYASLNLNNLPKLESHKKGIYPSLFIHKKPNNNYTVADKFQYIEGENKVLKFTTSPEYQIYNACPEKNVRVDSTYALKKEKLVTDFEASPLQQFVEGDFVKYNCSNPIKPVVLRSKQRFMKKFLLEYHIGFLIYKKGRNFDKLSEEYENFPEIKGMYNFIHFLTIKMDKQTESTVEASHQIISIGLPEQDLPYSDLFQINEKNLDIYGFDIDYLYTEGNQTNVFTSIFPERYSDYFSYPNQSLRKVQLVPHEDFQFETWKLTTFMDLNTTAMWEQLYSQWRRIEKFVRGVARKLGTLTIQTGATRVLALSVMENKREGINLLGHQKFPLHRYFWKLIKLRQSDDDVNTRAILIVMHNDPYSPNQEPICDDVSENWGWMVSNRDYKTGLAYGCKVDEHITRKLHDQFKVNYPSFDLNNVQRLESDENVPDIYPSLFVIKKSNNNYAVADKFQYTEGENKVVKFTTSPGYQLYNACPEKSAVFYWTYTLKVQESVTHFEAKPLEQFVQGDFVNYNCSKPIKPVALKSRQRFRNENLRLYDIGFLIHDKNANFDKLSTKYENFTEIQEYDFLHFLTIKIDQHSGATVEARHQIVSGGLLQPDLPYSDIFQLNEKNVDVHGFDVNSFYTEENQQKMFSLIFTTRSPIYYSYPNKSIRKVQLIPHEDFQLNTWKLTTLMDLNTTAMWTQLHSQWRKIEMFVRKVARELEALTIQTGVSRFLGLYDANKKLKSVFLSKERKFFMRKFVWKQITFRPSGDDRNIQAILIVMHNDPYTPDQKPICDDVSENWGWVVSNKDYKTGLTYGCEISENISNLLYNEFRVNYKSFNLNNVQKLESDENGEDKWVNENITSKIRSQ